MSQGVRVRRATPDDAAELARMRWETSLEDAPSIPFYERLGFRRSAEALELSFSDE